MAIDFVVNAAVVEVATVLAVKLKKSLSLSYLDLLFDQHLSISSS